jgi:hypothetical protein
MTVFEENRTLIKQGIKKCPNCLLIKDISEYSKRKRTVDGLCYVCR